MSRGPREVTDGGIYHVYARGNNKQALFHDPLDYQKYIKLTQYGLSKENVSLLAFALMPNHLHFLVKIEEASALSKFMSRIQTGYSMYFNFKHKHVGHVFQGRFQSPLVAKDEYLVYVSKYIHRNPVKAGLCDDAGKYPWSSYRNYLGEGGFNFIDTSIVEEVFVANFSKNFKTDYAKFVSEPEDSPRYSGVLVWTLGKLRK
jgi:REP element-mobilizing transposase RayT